MNNDATAAHCLRCRRALKSAKSIAAGYGPTCKAKIAAAAKVATAKPAQVAKAVQLVEDRAIVPLRRRNVFRVVSSRGDETYLAAAGNCNCTAGLKSRDCYHALAVRLVLAAA